MKEIVDTLDFIKIKKTMKEQEDEKTSHRLGKIFSKTYLAKDY